TDSKVPDAQSGYEKGYTEVLLAQAGCNMIYECAGMHASLLGFSFEGAILDNDMIGAVLRTVRGIEVDEDTLSIETIREVCTKGPGHFLGHSQTLDRTETDYIYPVVGDRTSPKEWVEQGSTNSVQRAMAKKHDILSTHYPEHISDEVDAQIREGFPIKLPRENMSAANKRY
ncbi:trimethylamine methyltransferase family protein, partial [Alphaproteobacteria bacterium]|nr:trimethylamine methyltransferase family protein [Alphaproteobacteria bacterium]